MNDVAHASDQSPSEPSLTEGLRRRIVLEEQLRNLSKADKRFGIYVRGVSTVALLATLGLLGWFWSTGELHDDWAWLFLPALYWLILAGSSIYARSYLRTKIKRELAITVTTQKTEELQDNLDKNFFTNLVKINFKYIDQYYLQTQLQADKSFLLCAIAACVSLLVISAGVLMLFLRQTSKDAGYVATAAGTLGEFIAAVFFYLYNQTITKMGEYHQKLVLTQNVSLALKISEELPPAEQVAARTKLIEYLSKDINLFLTARSPDIETRPKNSE